MSEHVNLSGTRLLGGFWGGVLLCIGFNSITNYKYSDYEKY